MNITDWIREELYPTLFESIDRAFPEHDFKSYSGGWRSKTYLDGSPHRDRIDKTVITKTAPSRILEQGGDTLSLIDYVIKRDGVEFIQAVKILADVVGLQLPKGDFNEVAYINNRDKSTILEDCNSYFIYCLENSTEAEEVREYLKSRGYSSENIKAMELGYIPSQDKLFNYLVETKGHSLKLIEEVVTIKSDTRIGATHKLAIPYRSGGYIKGFKFRTVGDATPKYLNTTGLDRNGGFFNLSGIKGDKDLIIVEGELDSLSATVRGIENVVATGGSSISSEQIKDAIKKGAKQFTICFDKEPDKEEKTKSDTEKAIEVILGEGVNRVYIVSLPDLGGGKTDPDRLIKESGVGAFKQAITEAVPYWQYKLEETLKKYGKLQEEREIQGIGLQPKDIDSLLEEVVETASNIPDPIDRDRYKNLFTSLPSMEYLGITEESLSITVDRLTSTKDKEAQAKEFKKLLSEATKLQDKGETGKGLELLERKVKEVKLQDKATEFSSLLKGIKKEDFKERIATKTESLYSGYNFGGEPLPLPSGAISIFTAPTSHGKTTFLLNLALNVSSQGKEVHVFSYEEDGDSILLKALNTYIDSPLSANNKRTIESFYKGEDYIKREERSNFIAKEDEFFRELIDSKKLNIHYSNYDSDTLVEAIRFLHKNSSPEAIFIDYIQLLYLPKGKYKTYSRQEEIKEICIALKDVAVETGLPIILGAQFNREVVNQLRIHATKIGEAGDIERIANLIVGFWNNNFKPLATEGEIIEINKKGVTTPNTLYSTILKNRGGLVGMEEILSFNGNTGKIKNSEYNALPFD